MLGNYYTDNVLNLLLLATNDVMRPGSVHNLSEITVEPVVGGTTEAVLG